MVGETEIVSQAGLGIFHCQRDVAAVEGELQGACVQPKQTSGVVDAPINCALRVDAAFVQGEGLELVHGLLRLQERAPDAAVVVDEANPSARVAAVSNDADDLEGHPAGVRAREHRGADDEAGVVGQRVARRRREQCATSGGRIQDEYMVQETLFREDQDEAEVDVVHGRVEAVVGRQGEGEARGGGVTGDEDEGELGPRLGRRGSGFPLVDEVTEEGRRPGNGEGRGAAPAETG